MTGQSSRGRQRAAAIVGALVAVAWVAGGALVAQPALHQPFEDLVARYLKEVRGIGGRAPDDMSAAAFERDLDARRGVLRALEAIDRQALSFDQDLDYRFLDGILRSSMAEAEQVRHWQQDPRLYLNISQLNYRLEADPRTPVARAADMIADLQLLQARIANGRKNLVRHVPRWNELTLPMIDGIEQILARQVPAFASRVPNEQAALLAENQKALEALRGFRTFVASDLARTPQGEWRIGEALFNEMQRTRYFFPEDDFNLRRIARGMPGFTRVPNYHDWGWRQFNIVERAMRVQARKIDPTRTWLQIVRDMKEDHPSAEVLVYAHHEATRKTREWVIEKDLVSIPWDDDDAIMVAAAPNQSMTQWWGFGPGVPAGSASRKAAWSVIPPNPDWPEHVIDENLTEKDYSFMWAIATHEVYPGHHLQRLYQNANPRPLRVYETSYYSNQAWCYYIEWELTPTMGFYPADRQELYTLEMLRLKLWRMGRVIIDSGLHTGRMGYDEALQLENERIGFVRRGAQINIDGITERGSMWGAPTVGYFEWMLLREDYFKKMRELDRKGTLKDFHDRVYKIGFIPIPLVREALFHELEQQFRPRATTAG